MSDLLDVCKDFEYEDTEGPTEAYEDNFSQILNAVEYNEEAAEEVGDKDEEIEQLPADAKSARLEYLKTVLPEFEEAFINLKGIESSHSPLSNTALFAYLHYTRGFECNKRTAPGVIWPEHPETLHKSRIYSPDPLFKSEDGCVEMAKNYMLQKALLRVCGCICAQRPGSPLIDPILADSIARRTAVLLQSVFNRAVSNRKSAILALSSLYPEERGGRDFDNVPVDWESVREAAGQLINQAALDSETLDAFSSNLDLIFKKQ